VAQTTLSSAPALRRYDSEPVIPYCLIYCGKRESAAPPPHTSLAARFIERQGPGGLAVHWASADRRIPAHRRGARLSRWEPPTRFWRTTPLF